MRFEIMLRGERAWHKRRQLTKLPPQPVDVKIPDFKKEKNHMCKMIVTYDNGEVKEYISRVVYNHIKDYWAVDGMHESVIVHED